MRPLGIPAYEDKLVQRALTKILQAIYEQDFLDFSYGFRPNRSCHDALKELNRIIEKGKISYVVDADIRGFFGQPLVTPVPVAHKHNLDVYRFTGFALTDADNNGSEDLGFFPFFLH